MKQLSKLSCLLQPLVLLLFTYELHARTAKQQEVLQQKGAGCASATNQWILDVNNVRTTILNGGDMWWNLSNARYEVPKVITPGQISKNVLSAGALWIGGIINGNLRIAAQTYRQNGNDYYPGPLMTNTASINSSRCHAFDRIWKITLTELDDFRNNPANWANPPDDILSWPAHGEAGEAPFIAPFVDTDGNNKYEPGKGDYPSFNQNIPGAIPDQMLFFVYNDKGNIHSETQSVPLGLEFQAQAFAYSTNDEINNMTFYRTKIINRSSEKIDSCMLAQWADPSIGNYADDYVQCDVQRNLAICYNGDDDDDGILGYGLNPPSVGIRLLDGPKNSNGELMGMTKFICYNGGAYGMDFGLQGKPTRPEHYYSYLNGYWKDGSPITYGGSGIGGTDTADFIFPGTTDPMSRPAWTENTALNTPGDRCFLLSSGPFSLLPGAITQVSVAVVWARNISGGATGSLELLKQASDRAEAFYHASITGLNAITYNTPVSTAYPNPGNDQLHFSYLPADATQIMLYDFSGKLYLSKPLTGNGTVETGLLPKACYTYCIADQSGRVLSSGKWIKH